MSCKYLGDINNSELTDIIIIMSHLWNGLGFVKDTSRPIMVERNSNYFETLYIRAP